MSDIKPGDVVCRKSYGSDIFFKVKKIKDNDKKKVAIIKGLDVRLIADAPLDDLEKKNAEEILEFRHDFILRNSKKMRQIRQKREKDKLFLFRSCEGDIKKEEIFEVPGKVVHIDGDDEYLDKCLEVYKQLNVPAVGFHIDEIEQPKHVLKILNEHNPDILVLTGHDALLKKRKDFKDINSYRNSKYFVEAVKIARKYEPSKDELIIIAGACQSHYEEILNARANFASSPKRIMIHAYDPVFIVERLSYTPIKNTVNAEELLENTVTGSDGIGGIETRGSYRIGFPKSPY